MRAFIAVEVPLTEGIKEKLNFLKKFSEVKTVEPENLHINLKFLGEIKEENLNQIKKAMETTVKPFEITLKNISAFPDENFVKVIKIGAESEELQKINKELENNLEKDGFKKEKRSYLPHVTLGRVKRKPDDSLKKIFDDKDYGTVKVKEIKLIKSEVTPAGPVYKELYVKEL